MTIFLAVVWALFFEMAARLNLGTAMAANMPRNNTIMITSTKLKALYFFDIIGIKQLKNEKMAADHPQPSLLIYLHTNYVQLLTCPRLPLMGRMVSDPLFSRIINVVILKWAFRFLVGKIVWVCSHICQR